ncbi:hypothetical protein B0T10DRAFT_487661 [Thelonectria olida]|uniref:ML-like domain-containing protein n=1 Tax=Thelonectria olida TaxID=1576542 RepID=A0A9P8W313_9HYPO|nr:hypothetical protein B0T10DRAFT_487661 [Thelonectria olida]
MRLSTFVLPLAVSLGLVSAARKLETHALRTCQDNSAVSASFLNVIITPDNSSVYVAIDGISAVNGKVNFDVTLDVYGYQFIHEVVDACHMGSFDIASLCPMSPDDLKFEFNFDLGSALDSVPGIAYGIPDLDATARAYVKLVETGESVACIEADFSTGKTVEQISVKWVTAIIIGLGLISSGIINILGYTNAAAHLAANTLALFSYFQAQAIIGFTGIHMPPIIEAWTQNFQWSIGIIRVGFLQDPIFTWYQHATGGVPANIFNSLGSSSVAVMKRSLNYLPERATNLDRYLPESAANLVRRGISKRANIRQSDGSYLVFGIQRVAFRSKIETTNLYLTGLVFLLLAISFTLLVVFLVKLAVDLCIKQGWLKNSHDRFDEFRTEWRTIMKGITLRLIMMGFPAIAILSLWEFTQTDSPGLTVLAVFSFFGTLFTLFAAALHIIRLAAGTNPTYSLFSDSRILNKWGYLYVQFRASAYFYLVPLLGYILVKSMFIALGQHNGALQAVALIVIEAIPLIATAVMRPFMDGSTNNLNIAIFSLNFINAIILLILANPFDMPAMGPSISAVLFTLVNAVFSLVLLIMTIVTTILIFWRKNPEARYPAMADDRTSFMKSNTQVDALSQLDALAATARNDSMSREMLEGLESPRISHGRRGYSTSTIGSKDRVTPETPATRL